MGHLNVEIKARCNRPEKIRQALRSAGADFRGTDHQVDTYFRCAGGRLKLREGNIEHSLIHYRRPDQAGPKTAEVHLYHPGPSPGLKEVLSEALGVLVVVDKRREIYFLDNVKFHIDRVAGLGQFVEIEAIDAAGDIGRERLGAQCEQYMRLLEIRAEDLVECSYSDMVMRKQTPARGR